MYKNVALQRVHMYI